jgi:hypothetical protein
MKKFVYTLSLLCFLVTSSFAQDANATESQELTKKEKRQLKKETKKKEKELKRAKKRQPTIKIGDVPIQEEVDSQGMSVDVNVNLGDKPNGDPKNRVKIQKGMSLSYGLISLIDLSSGLEFSSKEWAQNRPGTFFASSAQSWDIFYNQYRLAKSSFWLRTGASIDWSNLDFGTNNEISTFDQSPEPGFGVRVDQDTSTKRIISRLTTSYLEIPLELIFNGSGMGDGGLTIGVGGYLGVRMRTARKIRFDDSYAGMVNDIQRNRFYQNPLIYGLSARLGYGDIFIKCKVALNPMFQQNLINPVPYHAASLTLGIDFL